MNGVLKLLVGLAVMVVQVFIGARAFFPEQFETPNAERLPLPDKPSVVNKLTPEDLAFISASGPIKVGVDPNFYPLETFDERGRYTGVGGDYLRLLSRMTGLNFVPEARESWAATEAAAKNGEIDVFMAAARTGRRAEFMQFTAPYVTMPGIIMTRRDSGLDKLEEKDLAGKKVAVTRDYSWHDYLKEFHPDAIPVPAANTLEALQKVTSGEADAILDYEFNLLEKIQTAGILQMQTAGHAGSSYGHAIAVNKNKPELFNIISVALAQITPREKKSLADKWLNMEKPVGAERRLQWIFFFLTESVLVLLALNWFIEASVRKKLKNAFQTLARKTRHA